MTEPPEPTLPRWLPLAAATAVGVAGLAAAAVVVACRRKPGGQPAPPPPPTADPDPPRRLESFVSVLSAEKRAPTAQPGRVTSPLPPVDPKARRNYVLLLLIAAVVVWVGVVWYSLDAMAGPTYDPRPASPADYAPPYLGDISGVRSDRY